MVTSYDWTFRRIVWGTIVLAAVAFSFWLLYRFNQVVFLLFIAIVIGTVISPIVTWMHQRGLPRIVGIILVYLLLLTLLIGLAFLLYPLITEQSGKIAASVPGYYQSLRESINNSPNQLIVRLSAFLPATLPVLKPTQQTGQQVLTSAEQVLGYVTSAAKVLFTAVATLLLAYHWTLNGKRLTQSIMLLVPKSQRKSTIELVLNMETKVGFYIAGQGILCLVIGVMSLIAYLIIGLPNAFVLALLAGILEAVPMVGPLLGAIPAGAIALSIAPSKLVWVIVASLVIQQLENIVLVPRIMRKAVGVNPFVSILSIFAFSYLFGIVGALMAIPIAAISQVLLDRFVFHPEVMDPEVSAGRDFASRLRYEAQDLAKDLRKQARLSKGGSDLRVMQIDQMMDEIETITTDLDAMLARVNPSGAP